MLPSGSEQGVEFKILGPLEVCDGDAVLALRGRRQRALLAILLLHANEVVPAERLIEELWGDEAPESGIAALQVRVSQLRRALETHGPGRHADAILTRHPGYLLRVEPEHVDATCFERRLAEGRALRRARIGCVVAEVASQADGCAGDLARESGGTCLPFARLAAEVVVGAVEAS